jgi:hypothetical protein
MPGVAAELLGEQRVHAVDQSAPRQERTTASGTNTRARTSTNAQTQMHTHAAHVPKPSAATSPLYTLPMPPPIVTSPENGLPSWKGAARARVRPARAHARRSPRGRAACRSVAARRRRARGRARAHVVIALQREAVAAGVVRVVAAPARRAHKTARADAHCQKSTPQGLRLKLANALRWAGAARVRQGYAPTAGGVCHARGAVGVVLAAGCARTARQAAGARRVSATRKGEGGNMRRACAAARRRRPAIPSAPGKAAWLVVQPARRRRQEPPRLAAVRVACAGREAAAAGLCRRSSLRVQAQQRRRSGQTAAHWSTRAHACSGGRDASGAHRARRARTAGAARAPPRAAPPAGRARAAAWPLRSQSLASSGPRGARCRLQSSAAARPG